ncbi:hypothetical protein D3C81_1182150 [compost metagenome]
MRGQVIVTRADLSVLIQGGLLLVAFFVDAAQVQVRRVDVAVTFDQLLQITGRFIPVLGFQADQRQGVAQFVIIRVLLDQAGKLDLGVIQTILFNQCAGVGQAQALVVGVLADGFLQ